LHETETEHSRLDPLGQAGSDRFQGAISIRSPGPLDACPENYSKNCEIMPKARLLLLPAEKHERTVSDF
jgi:hypothetical protein